MKTLRLPLSQFGATFRFSKHELMMAAEMSDHLDQMNQQMVRTIVANVVKEDQQPHVYHSPEGKWDHFKLAVFPQWLLKRFPARMKEHKLSVSTLYPTLKTQIPSNLVGPFVTVAVMGKPIGTFMSNTAGCTLDEWNEKVEAILFKDRHSNLLTCHTCNRKWHE